MFFLGIGILKDTSGQILKENELLNVVNWRIFSNLGIGLGRPKI